MTEPLSFLGDASVNEVMPMSEENALLAAVLANPDDDAPRLILADWWEEHGQPERAEFCRVQCELADLDAKANRMRPTALIGADGMRRDALRRRERELAASGGRGPQLPSTWGLSAIDWIRGFIERLALPAADWLANAAAICSQHPVREVRLTTWPDVNSQWSMKMWVKWGLQSPADLKGVLAAEWPGITFHLPESEFLQHYAAIDRQHQSQREQLRQAVANRIREAMPGVDIGFS